MNDLTLRNLQVLDGLGGDGFGAEQEQGAQCNLIYGYAGFGAAAVVEGNAEIDGFLDKRPGLGVLRLGYRRVVSGEGGVRVNAQRE